VSVPPLPRTPLAAFARRRSAVAALVRAPVLFAAGLPRSRNYRANRYPFRASSHFLYLVGKAIPGAFLLLHEGKSVLFADPPDADDALWHGPRPTLAALREELGVDEVVDRARAADRIPTDTATLPPEDADTAATLGALLGRSITPSSGDRLENQFDVALAEAVIATRLAHDPEGIAQIRAAGAASAKAHVAGMKATKAPGTEAAVLAAMTAVLRQHGLADAYGPIVTVHGEVLHAESSEGATGAGDLLLADVGGETPEGWASDITRTWPVSGTFSSSQRAIYDVVLRAQLDAIALVRPGTRYRDVHLRASRTIVEGLTALGIFRGSVDGLVERNAGAIFFPHGVGHLLGVDVHDMEDLGDRAGYAPGRTRSERFGERFLRLDRDLAPGMVVTIEPGYYRVPAILGDERFVGALGSDLDRGVLEKFADVRGIRIEDDVLVTATGAEVLTSGVPKDADAIQEVMGRS
jgi:Xaa-Pro aminopeptidase